jgi:putative transposase
VAGGRLAGGQKGAAAAGATLVFTDESGLLVAPLLRTTLAPRGRTPRLLVRASQRDKVSVAAALWKAPGPAGLVRLAYRTYPDRHVDNERYAAFLDDVLACRLRGVPVVVLHDRGNMHHGEPVDALLGDVDRLVGFEPLPAYAPELNPVEAVWKWLKYDALANFAPRDVPHLDRVVNDRLYALHRDQPRLRTFLASTPLRW